jgi:tRNA dimethylallyltransferase
MKLSIYGKSKPVILLFGPTAVGKTAILFKLFKQSYEIISADSMQVYRKMDIGTAKPSVHELEQIPHHLIDIINPDEKFHAALFVSEADRLIDEILSRGHIPVISGGTAYYFRNFLFGLPEVPASNPEISKELQQRLDQGGREALFEQLQKVDPVSAKRIHINDSYRLVRALEVFLNSNRPLSDYEISTQLRTKYKPLVIGLRRDRSELVDRVNLRVDLMFDQGLEKEFNQLCESGYDSDSPGMKGIGYREFFQAQQKGHDGDKLWIANMIKKNSRVYAKKQMTFFNLIPDVRWFHPDEDEKIQLLIDSYLDSQM